ncbi:hypothetical protein K505DRAFT_384505 [Melanomma pulvis-pyrius CBS 109.77]|uniref:F-box domain-containing protein n=1 Tax=Melanomma pulvis-pyrius CBS 109.77 TaxID=1314802 RepID=A0A6A6XCF3_9PLEO|nr:hypothetical protein K505DRAFT_384505 [Melanomma pulvis-pyrius CBS 109.77]
MTTIKTMTSFSDFPAELKLYISEISEPRDSFSLAFTSKHTWQVCESIIRNHKVLHDKYGVICTDGAKHTFWDLLNDVLEKPHVANYVIKVQISSTRCTMYHPDNGYTRHAAIGFMESPPEDILQYLDAAQRSPFLRQPPRRKGWYFRADGDDLNRQIIEGAESPIIAIVLPLLRNLRELLYVSRGDDFWFMYALMQVGEAYKNNPSSDLPFQNLKGVTISEYAGLYCVDCKLSFILRLPALEWFKGSMIIVDKDDFQRAQTPTSNLKRLIFTNSNLDSETLGLLLSNIKNLKIFQYDYRAESETSCNAREMIAVLQRYCSHSLERLLLISEDEPGSHPVHLPSGFKCLKTLRCNFRDLVLRGDEHIDEGDNVADEQSDFKAEKDVDSSLAFDPNIFFPPSLEHLHIDVHDNSTLSKTDKFNMLDRLLASKKDALPNLEQVYVDVAHESAEQLAVFKAKAAERRIQFEPVQLEKTTRRHTPR